MAGPKQEALRWGLTALSARGGLRAGGTTVGCAWREVCSGPLGQTAALCPPPERGKQTSFYSSWTPESAAQPRWSVWVWFASHSRTPLGWDMLVGLWCKVPAVLALVWKQAEIYI